MAGEHVLAREVVELTTKGMAKTSQDIDKVKQRLQDADRNAEKLRRTMDRMAIFARRAFFVASAGVVAFVRAGLQGTQEGERLANAFKGLSNQIASAFLPRIDQLTSGIESLSSKLASLSGEQQEFNRNLLESAAAAGVTFAALSKLGGAKLGLAGLAGSLSASLLGINVRQQAAIAGAAGTIPGVGGIGAAGGILAENQLGILGKLQKAFEGRAQNTDSNLERGVLTNWARWIGQGRNLLGFKDEQQGQAARRDVTNSEPLLRSIFESQKAPTRGLEDIQDTFKRLQVSAVGEDHEQKVRAILLEILAELRNAPARARLGAIGGGIPVALTT